MALLFVDSFDHYDTADADEKWTDSGGFWPTIVAGAGSCGSQAARITVFNEFTKGIAFGSTTAIIGFHLNMNSGLGHINPTPVIHLGDTFGDGIALYRYTDGSLVVFRTDSVLSGGYIWLGASGPDLIRDQTFYFIELKTTIHASNGSAEVRVNGATVISVSGVDTLSADVGGATPTAIRFYGNDNESRDIDDLYVCDSTGSTNNDFLGPCRVEWIKPSDVGTHTGDWTEVGAASEWEAVRDASGPDDDATYITSSTAGDQHTSNMSSTSLPSGTIYGVQTLLQVRTTDTGFRGIKPIVLSGGTEQLGTESFPSVDYRYHHQIFEEDPDTSAQWTISGVNAVEIGVEVTS